MPNKWIISGEDDSRSIIVGVIKYKKSKKVGVEISLQSIYNGTSSVHLSLNEFSFLPGSGEILDNHLPVLRLQGVHEWGTTGGPNDGDYTFFDRIWEYPGDCGRLVRLGVKLFFNTATYICLMVYKRNGNVWVPPSHINLSLLEFEKLESLYADVYNCGMSLITNLPQSA